MAHSYTRLSSAFAGMEEEERGEGEEEEERGEGEEEERMRREMKEEFTRKNVGENESYNNEVNIIKSNLVPMAIMAPF